jgi:hypothetical protein
MPVSFNSRKQRDSNADELLSLLKIYPTNDEMRAILQQTDERVRVQLEGFGFGPTCKAFPNVVAAHLGKLSAQKLKDVELHHHLLRDDQSETLFILDEV